MAATDSATRYEAAIDAIDQEVARVTLEYVRETKRKPPSSTISEYLQSRVASLILLKQYLARKDTAAIDAILNGSLISIKAP
ncbi:MAG: hypothetical protein LBE22_05870 [Azoarcus sp.]|jgi:hypothetical protein|nr:hypothetical protein [Azoarcus sp.]